MKRVLLIALVLGGCTPEDPAPPPAAVVVPAPDPEPAPRRVPLPIPPLAPVAGTPAMDKLTPQQLLVAAEQARIDAMGYVGWKKSKPDNIDRITTLTIALDKAVRQMQSNKKAHRYDAGDVVQAREALSDLRSFLSDKGD